MAEVGEAAAVVVVGAGEGAVEEVAAEEAVAEVEAEGRSVGPRRSRRSRSGSRCRARHR